MMTEQDKDDNVDVLMPPPISVSPNDEAAAKNDVKKKKDGNDNSSSSSSSSVKSSTTTSQKNSGTTTSQNTSGTTGTGTGTTNSGTTGTGTAAAANIELLKSTTTHIVQSVTTGIQEHIIRPKSKAYIWHRTNGTARPYPIQHHSTKKRRKKLIHRRGKNNDNDSDNDEQNDDSNNDDNNNNNNNVNTAKNDNDNFCEDCNNCDCDCEHGHGQKHEHEHYRKPPCFACYAPPCVHYFANIIEQNWFCDTFGRIGCFGHDDFYVRRRILVWGLVANCISLVLSLIACLSISLNYSLIQFAAFTRGMIYLPNIDLPLTKIWIGLRGIAVYHYQGQETLLNMTGLLTASVSSIYGGENYFVIDFNDLCDVIADDTNQIVESIIDPDNSCDTCANASNGLVTAVIISTLLILPNITTDILRMYPNYDLNCQKFFGSIISLCSMLGSLYAWWGYARSCYRTFNTEQESRTVPFFMNNNGTNSIATESILNVINDGDNYPLMESLNNKTTIDVAFNWKAGTGLICIAIATFLKVIDIIAVWVIPTPDIVHKRQLQDEYEQLYNSNNEENVDIIDEYDDEECRDSEVGREVGDDDGKGKGNEC